MKPSNPVTVNGQSYDPVTGLPIEPPAASQAASTSSRQTGGNAKAHHVSTQRSKTLSRPSAPRQTKPAQPPAKAATPAPKPANSTPQKTAGADIIRRPASRPVAAQAAGAARHPSVKKFGDVKPPQKPAPSAKPMPADVAPRQHPHQLKAEQRIAQKKQAAALAQAQPLSSRQKKDAEIAKALASAAPAKKTKRPKHPIHSKRQTAIGLIVAGVIIIAGVLTWANLPSLSVRLAAAQSGISASLPQFIPGGYTLDIPVKTENDQVTMNFSSNQNQTSFTLSQEESSWDSEAVRMMVEGRSQGQFLTTQDRGLTIYTYSGSAAWVNKGMLYQISGDARLSNETITRIAASL